MADYVSEVREEGAERRQEEKEAGRGNEEKKTPLDIQSVEGSQPQAGANRENDSGGNVSNTPEGSPPPTGTQQELTATPITPGATVGPSTVRRVSFQAPEIVQIPLSDLGEGMEHASNNRTHVPGYLPSTSPSPTPGLLPPPDPVPNMRHRWVLGRRRDSEWVFRPLKLKFKVKELEELYRGYVYRQQQSLVFTACLIMVALSFIVVISFLVNTKVGLMGRSC